MAVHHDTMLALEGGVPVRRTRLPYGHHSIDREDVDAVVATLVSDYLTTGPKIAEFEEAFAAAVGARFAVAVSSGTAALHAAAFAANITPTAEVITTPLSFAATANCVRYQGGTVRFADVRGDTLTLDSQQVQVALTAATRAILTVDYAGQPSDLDELKQIAAAKKLVFIQDACHSLGATYRSHRVGGLADLTVFSLHPVKHITTGEGGMVTTNDPDLAARLRLFRSHGIASDHQVRDSRGSWWYEMTDLGYNYRLTDFQSALGLSQLRKLPIWLARRRSIASRYTAALSQMPELETAHVLPDREPAWHLYTVRLNLDRLRVGRDVIFKALHAENIGVNVHYIPIPWHPYYQNLGYQRGQWPVAEAAYERLLSLPIFPAMSDADVEDVVAALKKVLRHFQC